MRSKVGNIGNVWKSQFNYCTLATSSHMTSDWLFDNRWWLALDLSSYQTSLVHSFVIEIIDWSSSSNPNASKIVNLHALNKMLMLWIDLWIPQWRIFFIIKKKTHLVVGQGLIPLPTIFVKFQLLIKSKLRALDWFVHHYVRSNSLSWWYVIRGEQLRLLSIMTSLIL